MVSPQCLAAAAVAAGGEVEEGALLQAVWRWALVLAGFAGVLTLARSWIW
jgi:L-lactate permease